MTHGGTVVSLDAYRQSKAEPIDAVQVAFVEGRERSERLHTDLDAILANGREEFREALRGSQEYRAQRRSSQRDDAKSDVLATVRIDVESNLSKLKALRARLEGSESRDDSNVAPIFSDPLLAALAEGRAASVRIREIMARQGVTLHEY